MKAFQFLAAASLLLCLSAPVSAQHLQTRKPIGTPIITGLISQASSGNVSIFRSEEVVSITNQSARCALGHDPKRIDLVISEQTTGSFEPLSHGTPLHFAVPVSASGVRNVIDEKAVSVNVAYEPRAIGGILTIKVELVPLFAGIGIATRSTARREFASAVEDLDQDLVSRTVSKLTSELLASEYANK